MRTWEGWIYLAAVTDCYSRKVVGWSIADHLRSELVVDAVEMAIARRRPQAAVSSAIAVISSCVARTSTRRPTFGQPRRMLRRLKRTGEQEP